MDVLHTWSDSEGVPFVIQEGIWTCTLILSNDLTGPRALLGAAPSSIVSEEEATHALFVLRDAQARRDLHAQQLQHIRRLQAAGRPEMVLPRRGPKQRRTAADVKARHDRNRVPGHQRAWCARHSKLREVA